jgi:hypothetical protein
MKQQATKVGHFDPMNHPAYTSGVGSRIGESAAVTSLPNPAQREPGHRVRVAALLAVVALLLGLAVSMLITGDGGTATPSVTAFDREAFIRNLVDRGLVPAEALDWAKPSRESILRDLVNRGLIPRQALEPAVRSGNEILEDLVNRGLIPRQALEHAN